MGFTLQQLADAEATYAAMEVSVRHGDKSVTLGDLSQQWEVIQRIRRALQPASQRITHGFIRFKTRD